MKSSLSSLVGWGILFLLLCLGAFAGTLYIFDTYLQNGRTIPQTMKQEQEPDVSEGAAPFFLKPPSQSIRGILSEKTGTVKHKTRETNEYTDATPSGTIVLGESIATGADSHATVDILPLVSVSMEKNSEVVFANMFPENSVFLQKTGITQYTIHTEKTVSIRALHALIEANRATIIVSVDDDNVTITALHGEARIALVDGDNTTHVYNIPEGKRALIQDASRIVSITSPRE